MTVPFADLQLQYQKIKSEIDGAIAARFLNDVIKYLRAPSRLLMAP